MSPLLTALLLAPLASAEPPERLPESWRAPFAEGRALPPPRGEAPALAALRARLERLQRPEPPRQGAARGTFLAEYERELESASALLGLAPSQRDSARRIYLSRLAEVGAAPAPGARAEIERLLSRRAVGEGPRLSGIGFGAARPAEPSAAPVAPPSGTPGRTAPPPEAEARALRVRGAEPAAPAPRAPGRLAALGAWFSRSWDSLVDALPQNRALKVFDEAANAFPGISSMNTEQDAWRHARWSQRMVSDSCGVSGAWCRAPMSLLSLGAGTFHELLGAARGQPWAEFKMDLGNNWEGVKAAWSGGGREQVDLLLTEGRLAVLEPTGARPL